MDKISFGAARHIGAVRQANVTILNIHRNGLKKGYSFNIGRRPFPLNKLSSKGKGGFEHYIKGLSLEEVQSRLQKAELKLKNNMKIATSRLLKANPDNLSPQQKSFRRKVEN